MSLPSHGLMVKDGVIVGIGMCNIGWFFQVVGLHRCIKDTLTNAQICITKDREELANFIPWYPRYFGTVEDLQAFENVIVYNYQFNREIAMSILEGTMSEAEFVEHIDENGGIEAFRVNEKAFYDATDALRDPAP